MLFFLFMILKKHQIYYVHKRCKTNEEKSTENLPSPLLTSPYTVSALRPEPKTAKKRPKNGQKKLIFERRLESFVGLSCYIYQLYGVQYIIKMERLFSISLLQVSS